MKNLNEITTTASVLTVESIESIVTQKVTHNVTQKVTPPAAVTLGGENNNQPFLFSSCMYQTMPARHLSARSRNCEKVGTTIFPENISFQSKMFILFFHIYFVFQRLPDGIFAYLKCQFR
jgi:hypothetical protein